MRYLVLSFFLLGSLAGFAQLRWAIGLQATYLHSIAHAAGNPDVTDFYRQEWMPTASGGVIVQYGVSQRVKIESGLLLTGIGFRHLFNYTVTPGVQLFHPSDQSFTYFQVPVHLKYTFRHVSLPVLKMMRPYIAGGPVILFRTESAYNSSRVNANWVALTAIQPFLRPGANVGFGLETRGARGDAFTVSIFGQAGFTKLVEADWEYNANGAVYTGKLVNRGHFLAATASYVFRPIGYRRKSRS
jgi:hypothetical protein